MISSILQKTLFLQHGGEGTVSIPGQTIPAGTSPITAIIVTAVLIAIGIGLWILFTRKKRF